METVENEGERDVWALVDMEQQPTNTKALFRFRGLHEIEEKAYRDVISEKANAMFPPPFQKRITDERKNALDAWITGDEENAYYYFLRYLELLEEHPPHNEGNDAIIFKKNLNTAKKLMKNLAESLSKRYLYKMWEDNENLSILEHHHSTLEAEITATKKLHIAQQQLVGLQTMLKILKEKIAGVKRSRLEVLLSLEADEDIPEDLKCPICYQIYESPLIICGNGHTLCTECFRGLFTSRCPFCSLVCGWGREIRNRALESFKEKAVSSDQVYQKKIIELSKLEMAVQLKEVGVRILEEDLRKATEARMSSELRWWTLEGHLHNPEVAIQSISNFFGGMVLGTTAALTTMTFVFAMKVIHSGHYSVFLHPTQVVNGVWYGYQESSPSCRSFLSALQLLKRISGVIVTSAVDKMTPDFMKRTATLRSNLARFRWQPVF